MSNNWIPIDVYLMVTGFPLTCELSQDIVRRLAQLGFMVDDPSFLERHEKRISSYYRYKDGVHTESGKVQIYKTVG